MMWSLIPQASYLLYHCEQRVSFFFFFSDFSSFLETFSAYSIAKDPSQSYPAGV